MDFERILGGISKKLARFYMNFAGLTLMIRATRGRSMDGWMDGEVLIIGKVVGGFGGDPKGLITGRFAALVGGFRSLFLFDLFSRGPPDRFFSIF